MKSVVTVVLLALLMLPAVGLMAWARDAGEQSAEAPPSIVETPIPQGTELACRCRGWSGARAGKCV